MPIIIFADGASSGNPGPGGWGAIVQDSDDQVREIGGSSARTTNNEMELNAVVEALDLVRSQSAPVQVFTDSTYIIRGITQWIHGWRKNGWKTTEGKDVANQALWKKLADLVDERGKSGAVQWTHVPGHSGIPANERVDEIAVAFTQGKPIRLYQGKKDSYSVSLSDLKPKSNRKGPALFYLSLVDGKPMRHKSWPECEQRVKGRTGAKYKKVTSAEQERELLNSWGFEPEDL